jgi:type II secretory pathway pseudopilin PulG
MFQLIVAVVAVALVVLIGVAMIFFGGSAFTSGTDRALYAQLMNHGSQIEGAMKLYQSDYGTFPAGVGSQAQLQQLKDNNKNGQNYLTAVPQGDWYINQGVIYRSLTDIEQCKRVNVVAKMDVDSIPTGCPQCDDANYSAWPACSKEQLN